MIKAIGEVTVKVELPVPQLLQAGGKGKATEVRVLFCFGLGCVL
jgi:hypothetical protein